MRMLSRLTSIAIVSFMVSSCESVSNQIDKIARFIDGQDRIEMEGSTVEVTAIVPQEAEIRWYDEDNETSSVASNTLLAADEDENITGTEQETTIDALPSEPTSKKTIPLKAKPPVEYARAEAPAILKKQAQKVVKPKTDENTTRSHLPYSRVSGRIVIDVKGDNDQTKNQQSIVRLIPINGTVLPAQHVNKPHKEQIIDMLNKEYQPAYLATNKDDTVVFTNSDKISHNVFSRSGKNAFDLGTYAGGKKRGVSFNDSGIVKIYCNIHPNMATFVSVIDEGYSLVTDMAGAFTFDEVPYGDYRIEAWNIRGSTSSTLKVSSQTYSSTWTITNMDPEFVKHKNKFGQAYSDKPALFKDEFY